MGDYERLETIVRALLSNAPQPFAAGFIETTIAEYKMLAPDLSAEDLARMARGFEMDFNVKTSHGAVIQSEQNRDRTWWSGRVKGDLAAAGEDYYFARFKQYVLQRHPHSVVQTLDDDTDVVMNNIGHPPRESGANSNLGAGGAGGCGGEESFGIFGMVVGHVQSGKTLNYSALICKAADAGYKFIVVIAGDKNNLRNQTQKRLDEYFVGRQGGKFSGVGNIPNRDNGKNPHSFTTQEGDFDKKTAIANANGATFETSKVPFLAVIKKNSSTLQNIIKWLKTQYPNGVNYPVLVIDDESDYASVNTKSAEDPSKINALIRELLGIFSQSSYVAYTATPFANIFISDDAVQNENAATQNPAQNLAQNENDPAQNSAQNPAQNADPAPDDPLSRDLFPRDFIYALAAPDNYFGAKKIFLDEGADYLVDADDLPAAIPLKHKITFAVSALPASLREAVRVFALNCAIRHLRGQTGHNSMLIHVSRFTAVQRQIYEQVAEYLDGLKGALTAFGSLPAATAQAQSPAIRELYDTFAAKFEFEREFGAQKVIDKLANSQLRARLEVKLENNKSAPANRIEYRSDRPTNVIAVGGAALSRGFTLEGLSVSYFARSSIFYDTLMQMGRWFGYRVGYEDLCKIYMPREVSERFSHIIQATDELMAQFDEMARDGRTPREFGLTVRQTPEAQLQITARNKMRGTQRIEGIIDFRGRLKSTTQFYKDDETLARNLATLKEFAAGLDFGEDSERHRIARGVAREEILRFLGAFKVKNPNAISLPIWALKNYIEKKQTAWDVVFASGEGGEESVGGFTINRELRKVSDRGDFYVVATRGGLATGNISKEQYVLDKATREQLKIEFERDKGRLKDGDKALKIRAKLERPVLILHILEVREIDKLPAPRPLAVAAFSVCFPNSANYEAQRVSYVLNQVAQREWLEENGVDLDGEGDGDE